MSTCPPDMLQVVSTIDAAIDKFKRNPVPLEMQAGAPQHQVPYQQYPTAGSTAVPGAYQDPQTAYPAAAGATAPYAGAAYNAAAYSHGQYGAYSQQPYQQPYAAAAAQGESVPLKAALPEKFMYYENGLGPHLCGADHGWCTPAFAFHGQTLAWYASGFSALQVVFVALPSNFCSVLRVDMTIQYLCLPQLQTLHQTCISVTSIAKTVCGTLTSSRSQSM